MRAPGVERQPRQVFAVQMQHVECVEHHRVLRMGAAVLKRLEGGTSVAIDGDDFAIEYDAFRL